METLTRKGISYRVVDNRSKLDHTKICRGCEKLLPLPDFPVKKHWRPELKTPTVYVGYDSRCKICRPKYMKEYYDREKPTGRWNLASRKSGLKVNYGLSEEEYEDLLESQGGGCAICGVEDGDLHKQTGKQKKLAVDHNEETKTVRGLLCQRHNMGIGLFDHDPELLITAAAYLIKSEEVK